MEAGKIGKVDRLEIIERVHDALEPWVPDIALIAEIDEETNLIADLGLDSIGILQFILEIEKEFGLSVKNHELDSQLLSRIGNIVNMIQEKLNENN
jgi:acyl carrier protein